MISGEKILVTGASGQVGLKLGAFLAASNEVWGLARYAEAEQGGVRQRRGHAQVESAGMKPVAVDLGAPDFSALPDDFTYVLHLSHTRRGADEFVEAIDINAIGAGLLLQHCRRAKAALVVSSTAVYSPNEDVFHPFPETADIGRAWAPWAPTSPISKVSLEAVSRFCARAFSLPVSVMRLNTLYGPDMAVLPILNMDAVVAGRTINAYADPNPHSPIHVDDMCDQLEALLGAASIHGEIINWCGDEVVTQRQWCQMAADWSGQPLDIAVKPIAGIRNGNVSSAEKRKAITGPCRRTFEPSFREIFEDRHGPVQAK